MKHTPLSRTRREAQTLVFFLLSFGTIFLLCGFAIDSGLLYLAKARLSRAVDGAALAAVGNFHQSDDPVTNRDLVASTMRNFATINFTDLESISTTGSAIPGGTSSSYALPTGGTGLQYTYNFNDGTVDSSGNFRRYIQVVLQTGSGGEITSATCTARCPARTYFMGYAGSFFSDLKVSSSAVATRNPRLIMVVIDRSASMLAGGGGAYGLPQAVVSFLDFFDTSSDYIGIVSFSSNARLEMPLTTNFLIAGTNNLYSAYAIDSNEDAGIPGPDPEEFTTNSDYEPYYATEGVRRMKFGGDTAADEGVRLAMEQMMANSGFNNPNVQKYLVLFTDGAWNNCRTLLAAPGYTNVVLGPPAYTNGHNVVTNNTTDVTDTNYTISVPTLNPWPDVNVEIATTNFVASQHARDIWQSIDTSGLEPLADPTTTQLVGTNDTYYATNTPNGLIGTNSGGLPIYTSTLNVWLQPGAVDYVYDSNGNMVTNYVSNYTDPTNNFLVQVPTNGSNVLVVPGYVVDGCFYDGLDLAWAFDANHDRTGPYNGYSWDNFNEPFMWPDDSATNLDNQTDINNYANGTWGTGTVVSTSQMRSLLFRNYANLLTGFYVFRPDDPTGVATNYFTGTLMPRYGLGPYYPSAGFYWPFDMVGVDFDPTYCLTNATNDPDLTSSGYARRIAYSINMLSDDATPEWSGEWFYGGTQGTGVVTGTANTSISTLMSSASTWQNGAPDWLAAFNADMISDAPHDTNITPNPAVWRPNTFIGSPIGTTNTTTTASSLIAEYPSSTGGYVMDGNGNVYRNSMAWSGRPTHYYDFSQSKWVSVTNNHTRNIQALPLGNWKVQEYAWHARAMGVTIYTVGYGSLVSTDEQVLLAQIANATNTTAGNLQFFNPDGTLNYTDGPGTNIPFNSQQPIGAQFFASTADEISNKFYFIGQAINAALTQ